ncbi:hypothetical protein [Saccharopolyspora hattusasensis]
MKHRQILNELATLLRWDGCHDVGSATNVVRAVDELSRASWAWRVDGR